MNFCALCYEFPAEPSSGILGGPMWYVRSGGALVFGVLTFPFQLIGNILSSLASLVSSLLFPLRLRSDDHEPLQRRLTRLEEEVRKWKPLQEILPKQIEQQPAAVGDHSQKLTVLETELANTRKVGVNLNLHLIMVYLHFNFSEFIHFKVTTPISDT